MAVRPIAVLLACAGCAGSHTVTLFVPVKDVPTDTTIVAAVTAGTVQQFPVGATLRAHGEVTRDNQFLGRVRPTDTLVIEAGPGDQFGSLRVRRKDRNVTWIVGLVLGVGGFAASFIAAGVAMGSESPRCFDVTCPPDFGAAVPLSLGFAGMFVSVVLGSTLFFAGINGPLVVRHNTSRRTSFSPTGLVVRF